MCRSALYSNDRFGLLISQEVYADIGGMRGNCAQLERVAARKGDETDPLFQDAMFTVGKAKQEIADFMVAHKLDAIIGGLGLSLLPALCGAPIVSDKHPRIIEEAPRLPS